ncbi:MAG: Gfo/Idh/MocA family oxidoreductase [Armatimonadetes bacterium]|nr:Gfo/Idh/MocA family oxidoreductase [Armatimonadota bacterium]
MNSTRLCMIGAGRHASRLIYSCFPLLQNAQVVANADLDEERATSIARKYGIERSYTDYRQMLAREKPDGVIICVGADFHARTAVEVMDAGYHVYTEKAPALDLEQCRQMLKAHQRSGKVCMTAFKKRFAPAYQKARAVIEREDFGQQTLLTITRTSGHWHEGEDSVLAYLRENSIHVVDLVAYLFGPVKRVSAMAHSVATAAMTFEFINGGIGTLAVTDRMSYARGWEVVTAVGSGGICIQVDNSVEMNAFKFDQPIAAHKPEFVAGTSMSAAEQGFSGELQAFVDAIRNGTRPDASIEHAVHAMAILKAVKQSFASGQTTEVENFE